MASTEIYQGDCSISGHERKHRNEYSTDIWSLLKKTLFIIGSAYIIFSALSNTLTYQLQRFWGASGNFWQHQWNIILDTFGDDTYYLFVYGTTIVGYCVYWSVGLMYTFMDLTGLPKSLRRYKIQPGTNEPLDIKRFLKLLVVVHCNQFISLFAGMVFYKLYHLRGFDGPHQLPTFHWVLFELVVCILVEEIGFYYSHRLFHHKFLYKHLHKQHHEWQAPIAVTAIYCHPLEHVFSNLLPIFAGALVMGSHIATVWLWASLAIISTLNAHSGYHLPFFPSPEAHDFHHLKFNQCYGVLGILDLLHGTDDKFRASKCFSRHILMLSFTPPREAFPEIIDDKNMKGKL